MKLINKITIFFSTMYILWRFTTIPTNLGTLSIIFSCIFLFIEVIDYIELLIVYFNSITKSRANIYKKKNFDYADIDIIIPTINEPISIIKRTLDACKNIKYNFDKIHIFVSDDGNRNTVKKLVEEYNFTYLARKVHSGAKAGNINFALNHTKSDYILFLDCDMAPKANILEKLMPYIVENKNIGFVQAPQSFVNADIFQSRFNLDNDIPNDQNYFYNVLQNSNNSINSVILCGTNVVIRRKALQDIGGFDEDIIAEDFATGMLIQSKGYKGIYVNENVAEGYQEESLKGFIKQRSRWQRGCIRTGKKYHIILKRGLTIKQKMQYIVSINYWLQSIKIILFWIAPILYNIFHIYLINCKMLMFLAFWIPQYVLKRFILDKNYYGMTSNTWNKIYQSICAPIFFINAIMELIGFKKKKFDVSAKKAENLDKKNVNFKKNNHKIELNFYSISLFLGHFIFLALNFITYLYSLNNLSNNIFELMTLFWSSSNMFYLIISIIFDLSKNKNTHDIQLRTNRYTYNHFAVFKVFKLLV